MDNKDDYTRLYEAELEREKEQENGSSASFTSIPEEPLSKRATLKLIFGALSLSLGIGFFFLLVFFLFILFCIYVWF